ncbi:hypothetical protein CCHR01_17756 [Colletotrichum chrysophilum]|uniref:Uncharacterized protein n=1 Tax=Colletotrichum chrysophilum TaxID=1836956 RepID=A0AAD9E9J7_9PEZI|nr:hypothetical protein CCHR01_17756 [Colletotrichum chrysophilum]
MQGNARSGQVYLMLSSSCSLPSREPVFFPVSVDTRQLTRKPPESHIKVPTRPMASGYMKRGGYEKKMRTGRDDSFLPARNKQTPPCCCSLCVWFDKRCLPLPPFRGVGGGNEKTICQDQKRRSRMRKGPKKKTQKEDAPGIIIIPKSLRSHAPPTTPISFLPFPGLCRD